MAFKWQPSYAKILHQKKLKARSREMGGQFRNPRTWAWKIKKLERESEAKRRRKTQNVTKELGDQDLHELWVELGK